MKFAFGVAVMLLVVPTPGCGSRGAYDVLRFHQDQRCLDLRGADRDRCLQQNEMSYDEYQRQLKERDQETER